MDLRKHLHTVMRAARDTGDGAISANIVHGRHKHLSVRQVGEIFRLAAQLGYGEIHYHGTSACKDKYIFVLHGHNVPWTGQPVKCTPEELWTYPESYPTDYLPQTPEKVELMRRRFALGLPLHIPGDVHYVDEGFLNHIWS